MLIHVIVVPICMQVSMAFPVGGEILKQFTLHITDSILSNLTTCANRMSTARSTGFSWD